jgi:hypothetical protein
MDYIGVGCPDNAVVFLPGFSESPTEVLPCGRSECHRTSPITTPGSPRMAPVLLSSAAAGKPRVVRCKLARAGADEPWSHRFSALKSGLAFIDGLRPNLGGLGPGDVIELYGASGLRATCERGVEAGPLT